MENAPIAVILAAGLGKRMRSDRPKVLHEVGGRPLIEWTVNAAQEVGASPVVAVVGHQRDRVVAHLEARYGRGAVVAAHQREPRGTGDAVSAALGELGGEDGGRVVAILSGDVPLLPAEMLASLVAACERAPGELALISARAEDPTGYGRIVRGPEGGAARVVEELDATPAERSLHEVNAGFYAAKLARLRDDVESLSGENAQGELYLTDLVARASRRGRVDVLEAPWDEVAGINDRQDLAAVEASYQARRRRALMRAGATLAAPEQTFIDADAGPVGADVWLGPGVQIRGRTRIADRTRIDAGCVLVDTEVGAGAVLGPYCVLRGVTVGEGERIEPFARRSG